MAELMMVLHIYLVRGTWYICLSRQIRIIPGRYVQYVQYVQQHSYRYVERYAWNYCCAIYIIRAVHSSQ